MVVFGLKHFDRDSLEWLKEEGLKNAISSRSLAKKLCTQMDWKNQAGNLCVDQALEVLPKIEEYLQVSRPHNPSTPRPASPRCPVPSRSDKKISCSLKQLGKVTLELVETSKNTAKWQDMMSQFHPFGASRHKGGTRKYFLKSSRYGTLGGISFHHGEWAVKPRDQFIGWSYDARYRCQNLQKIVLNSRFLILPHIKVSKLASHALSLAEKTLPRDWERKYGVRPVWMYTYIDPTHHKGTSYAAASWDEIGYTSGRRDDQGIPKMIMGKALNPDFQKVLCHEEKRSYFPRSVDLYVGDSTEWEDMEYGGCTHPDGRVQKRIKAVGAQWAEAPSAPLSQKFACSSERKAVTRLLSNRSVTVDHILESHRAATANRCLHQDKVLVVQDSTTLNLENLKRSTKGLHSIGGKGTGICVHASVAFNQAGVIQGCLNLDGEYRNQVADQQTQGQDARESYRWIEGLQMASNLSDACGSQKSYQPTRVINVGDRESETWQYYEEYEKLKASSPHLGFVLRCKMGHRRKVSVDHKGTSKLVSLEEHMESMPLLGQAQIFVEGKPQALDLRMSRVKLMAPQSKKQGLSSTQVFCVLASFADDPSKKWFLTSSEGSDQPTAEEAMMIVDHYSKRWKIEEFFRTLKTNTQIESLHRFDDIKDFLKTLGFDAVTAYRVAQIEHMAKHEPEQKASLLFTALEFTGLYHLMRAKKLRRYIPKELEEHAQQYMSSPLGIVTCPGISIKNAAILLGRAGGFTPTKKQAVPGYKILWRAYADLQRFTLAAESIHEGYHSGRSATEIAPQAQPP